MSNIKALRQRKADLKNKMENIYNHAKSEQRGYNEAEAIEHKKLKVEFNANEELLILEEQELEASRALPGHEDANQIAASMAAEAARTGSPFDSEILAAELKRRNGAPGVKRGGRRYAEMFGQALSNDGWASNEEFLRTVHSGLNDRRLRPVSMSAAMNEKTPSSGGFFVPETLAAQMLDKSLENEIVRPRADIQPMTSETKKIAGFDGSDHSGGSLYGGFKAVWLDELAPGTPQQPKVRLLTLTAKKMALFSEVSNELLADGESLDSLLGEAMINSVGWNCDDNFLNGDGAGKPLGVVNDPALITVAKESGQPGATISYQNVTKMFARLHPACVGNSVWVANSTTIPQLLQMQLAVMNLAGTENVGGSAVPVVSQNGGQMTLLTRPILFTEKLPAVGTVGDLILADFSQYSIGLRRGISIERSNVPGWTTDSSSYRCICRVDGMGRWAKPLTPKSGQSQSWVVALATRS